MNINCASTWKGCGKIYDNSSHHYIMDTNVNVKKGKKKKRCKHLFKALFNIFQVYGETQFDMRFGKQISLWIVKWQTEELGLTVQNVMFKTRCVKL